MRKENMNPDGRLCPNCNNDIGLWAIIKAWLPTKLKCPHCKTKLTYEPWQIPLVILCIILYITLLIALSWVTNILILNIIYFILTWALLCIALWQPFELLIAYYLRNKSKLKTKKGQAST